jgi:pyruvate,orthophosphate dikinase
VNWSRSGEKVILVRRETNPDDLNGMIAAQGILTSRGGKTSHAAVVARGMGKTCVCGAEELDVDTKRRRMTAPDRTVIHEGEIISVDGSTGLVYAGEVPVVASPVVEYFEGALDAESPEADELVRAVHRIMGRADAVRRLRVRANADTVEDAGRARRFGAQGIGLCRTEHMFLGERRQHDERLILARDDRQRAQALEALLPLQRWDFLQILTAMDGLPTTIRLLDPPLHEFVPDITELSVRVALAEARGEKNENDLRLMQAVHSLHEQNPMLGLRGVRLGLVVPGLFDLQVRAIVEATAQLIKLGKDPKPEIMIPLVGSVQELEIIEADAKRVLIEVTAQTGVPLNPPIGPMIELPRAALTAGQIAEAAEFFSFGTNDLTQDHLGVLPRRRRGSVLPRLPRDGHLRDQPVRDPRCRWRRRACQDRNRTGPGHPPRPQGRCVRRTRRRPRIGALLPPCRPGLRFPLTLPHPRRATRSRTCDAGGNGPERGPMRTSH